MAQHIVNSVGLIFGLAGGIVLFFYGVPALVSTGGHSTFVSEQPDPQDLAKELRYKRMSKFGLGMIVAGFALQLIGTWC